MLIKVCIEKIIFYLINQMNFFGQPFLNHIAFICIYTYRPLFFYPYQQSSQYISRFVFIY